MEIICVFDEQGRIISVGKLGETGEQPSGITSVNVIPQQGQRVVLMDLPTDLEKSSLLDLHKEFRVSMKGGHPRLVKTKEFEEPFEKG